MNLQNFSSGRDQATALQGGQLDVLMTDHNRFYALFFSKFRQSLHNEPFSAEMTGIHHA